MSDEVQPAMTAEEWATKRVARDGYPQCAIVECEVRFRGEKKFERGKWFALFSGDGEDVLRPATAHAIAALALHGQPFGFTRDDLAALRQACKYQWGLNRQEESVLYSLAARIAALLPPEDA